MRRGPSRSLRLRSPAIETPSGNASGNGQYFPGGYCVLHGGRRSTRPCDRDPSGCFGSNPLIRIPPNRFRAAGAFQPRGSAEDRHAAAGAGGRLVGTTRLAGWCVWLVGGDCASGFVFEGGLLGVAARADAVIVQQFVVAGAEQDEVVELGLAAVLERGEVVGLELAGGGAGGVLAVG
jgi:hypothetical protein